MAAKRSAGPGATASPRVSADEKRWRAEDALRTIARAAEHQKNPSLMRDVRRVAADQAKAAAKAAAHVGAGARARPKK